MIEKNDSLILDLLLIITMDKGGDNMRIKFEFELTVNEMPSDYRRCILSYFKKALEQYTEGELKEKFYKEQDPIKKPFTFSIYLPQAKFEGDKIHIASLGFSLIFSTYEYETGLIFYNALIKQKNRLYPLPLNNSMKLKYARLIKEEAINTDCITVKALSPICVREHTRENNKDVYYSFLSDKFSEMLKIVVKNKIKDIAGLTEDMVDGFSIEPLAARKTVAKYYSQMIEVSIGTFILKGHPILLNYLYLAGMGSKVSSGFGMIETV